MFGWWSGHLQSVEGDDSVGFLKNLPSWVVTVKYGGVSPSCLVLPEQVVGKFCPISHLSLHCATQHPVQTLILGTPVKSRGWGTLQLCQASCAVALMAVEPVLSRIADPDVCAPCFYVPRWSQRAAFHCVAPELKLHPQALLCINWSSLEWNGKHTYFKNILFGILILI